MKKVLLITVRSDEGGGPKHVAQILEHLNGEFEFYTASPYDPPYFETYSQKSAGHFFLPHRKASLMKAFDLLFWCRDNKIDTVHTHGRGAAFYGFFLGLLGIKTIHTFHGVHPRQGLFGRFIQLLERIVYIFNSNLIFVSSSEKNNAHKCGFITLQKTSIIPNGVNIESIQNEYDKITTEESRNLFCLPQDKIILGTLSRLDPHKQNEKLIKALAKLDSNYYLVIAGDGEQRDELKSLISKKSLSDKVLLLGNIKNPVEFLKGIDVYVSYSKGEGLPYSILEAIACRKPLVISNVSGHRDLVSSEYMFNNEKELLNLIKSPKEVPITPAMNLKNTITKIKEDY